MSRGYVIVGVRFTYHTYHDYKMFIIFLSLSLLLSLSPLFFLSLLKLKVLYCGTRGTQNQHNPRSEGVLWYVRGTQRGTRGTRWKHITPGQRVFFGTYVVRSLVHRRIPLMLLVVL